MKRRNFLAGVGTGIMTATVPSIVTSDEDINENYSIFAISREELKSIDPETGEEIWDASHDGTNGIGDIALSPNREIVYVGDFDGFLTAYDTSSGDKIRELDDNKDRIRKISLSPGGNFIYVGYQDEVISYNTHTFEKIWERGVDESISAANISHDGRYLYYTFLNENLFIKLNAKNGDKIWESKPFPEESDFAQEFGKSIETKSGGDIVYTSTYFGYIRAIATEDGIVYDGNEYDAGEEIWNKHIDEDNNSVESIRLSYDEDVLYSGVRDNLVMSHNPDDGEILWESSPSSDSSDSVRVVAPSLSGDYLYIGSQEDKVRVLDASDGESIWEEDFSATVYGLAIPTPFSEINDIDDIYAIENDENDTRKNYVLVDNIDASETESDPIDLDIEFKSTLHGNGYSITNLYTNNGLFETIEDTSITDLDVQGSILNNSGDAGLLSQESSDTNIINVSIDVATDDVPDYVGGIVGKSDNLLVKNTSIEGNITGKEAIGGIVGDSNNIKVVNVQVFANIIGDEFDGTVGGLIGDGSYIDISKSYFIGEIEHLGDGDDGSIGGFAGSSINEININESYVATSVVNEGDKFEGIIAGVVSDYDIDNVYVDVDKSGGLGHIGNEEDNISSIEELETIDMIGDEASENMDEFNFDDNWEVSDTYPHLQIHDVLHTEDDLEIDDDDNDDDEMNGGSSDSGMSTNQKIALGGGGGLAALAGAGYYTTMSQEEYVE